MVKRVLSFMLIILFFVTCHGQKTAKKNSEPKAVIEVSNLSMLTIENTVVDIDLSQLPEKLLKNSLKNYVLAPEDPYPFQLSDLNKDGMPDRLTFICTLNPGEKREYVFGKNIKPEIPFFEKKTQAEISVKQGGEWKERKYIGGDFVNIQFLKVPPEHTDHSYFIRYEGPGWESDKAAYRFYLDWRNAVDFFGKKTGEMTLQIVGQDGFDSYHEPAEWGMDVLKVGESLGIGSIAMWKDNKANRVALTDSVTCEILLNGIVQSMIETKYYGWKIGETKTNLTSRLSIAAGNHITRHDISLSADVTNLCTGIMKDKNAELILNDSKEGEWSYIATFGKQSLADDHLGLAVFYRNSQLLEITGDSKSHVVVLKPENRNLTYYFLAVWEQEPLNIHTKDAFVTFVEKELLKLNNPVSVKIN